jgi:hypothetical protein
MNGWHNNRFEKQVTEFHLKKKLPKFGEPIFHLSD